MQTPVATERTRVDRRAESLHRRALAQRQRRGLAAWTRRPRRQWNLVVGQAPQREHV